MKSLHGIQARHIAEDLLQSCVVGHPWVANHIQHARRERGKAERPQNRGQRINKWRRQGQRLLPNSAHHVAVADRSEEHTSELQSHVNLVCRLLLEKKKKKKK